MNWSNPNWNNFVEIPATAFSWMVIYGYLCLALRHPVAKGPSRKIAELMVGTIENMLLRQGLLSQEEIDHIHNNEQVERDMLMQMRDGS